MKPFSRNFSFFSEKKENFTKERKFGENGGSPKPVMVYPLG